MLSKLELERLKSNVSITDIMLRYNIETKSGREFKILCPFHSEKTPSFFVNTQKNRFKCFGCGVAGDVIDFIKMITGCSFKDAIKIIGGDQAMTDHDYAEAERQRQRSKIQRRFKNGRDKYRAKLNYSIFNHLAAYSVQGGLMINYLKNSRGWTDDFIKNSPDLREITQDANKCMISVFGKEWLIESGTYIELKRGCGLISCLGSRLLIPWRNSRGDVTFIQGRDLTGKSTRKYYNVGKTPLLFCTDWQEFKKQKEVRVFEGALDAILWHQISGEHCFAIAGTGMSDKKIRTIVRYFKKTGLSILLCFDHDAKGQGQHLVDRFCEISFKSRGFMLILPEDPTRYGCCLFGQGDSMGRGYGKDLTACWVDYRERQSIL